MTRFTVVSILPEIVDRALAAGVVGRARTAGALSVAFVNPRDFTHDKHRSVDDTPYGGGPGMVMRCEPLVAAIEAAVAAGSVPVAVSESESEPVPESEPAPGSVPESEPVPEPGSEPEPGSVPESEPGSVPEPEPVPEPVSVPVPVSVRRIFLGPGGAPLTQATVRRLATYPHVVLVCGRYEGVDQRVLDTSIDEELSLGDFVLTGGELAAACVIDAVARFLPGVLGDAASADDESFAAGLLEYPQYTRPAAFRGRAIPDLLTGGNHEAIRRWRRAESLRRTARRRPDLYARVRLERADRKLADDPALDVAARTSIALVHHPVFDRTGAVITSAVTNLDVHDLARSARTFGLARYFVVTPIESQRAKAQHIADAWQELADADAGPRGPGGGHDGRASALRIIAPIDSVDAAIAALTAHHGHPPLVAATSADPARFPAAARVTPAGLVAALQDAPGVPLLLLFGTGWGLADARLPTVTHLLPPIESRTGWNHLSVRSAAAIVLSDLFALETSAPNA